MVRGDSLAEEEEEQRDVLPFANHLPTLAPAEEALPPPCPGALISRRQSCLGVGPGRFTDGVAPHCLLADRNQQALAKTFTVDFGPLQNVLRSGGWGGEREMREENLP